MRPISYVPILLVSLAAPGWSQPSNAYMFVAPGGVTCCGHTGGSLHFGVGGEAVLGAGIGLGAEIGAMGPTSDYLDNVVGVFSPNGYYHFVHGRRIKADPFVTGGYTLMFRNGHADLFNVGGGLNYWFRPRLGARLEFRDHIYRSNGISVHYWSVRFGVVL